MRVELSEPLLEAAKRQAWCRAGSGWRCVLTAGMVVPLVVLAAVLAAHWDSEDCGQPLALASAAGLLLAALAATYWLTKIWRDIVEIPDAMGCDWPHERARPSWLVLAALLLLHVAWLVRLGLWLSAVDTDHCPQPTTDRADDTPPLHGVALGVLITLFVSCFGQAQMLLFGCCARSQGIPTGCCDIRFTETEHGACACWYDRSCCCSPNLGVCAWFAMAPRVPVDGHAPVVSLYLPLGSSHPTTIPLKPQAASTVELPSAPQILVDA